MSARRRASLSVIFLFALLPPFGNVLEGQIADIDGGVELVDPAPDDVQLGTLQSDETVYAFDERQNVRLEEDLPIDTTTGDVITPGVIPAGTVVNSHLIHADPLTFMDVTFFPIVTVFFETEILGFYFKNPPTALHATDELLGLPGTQYEKSDDVPRGAGGFPIFDQITILGEDRTELMVTLTTGSGNMDEIRVITRGEDTGEDPELKFTRGDCNSDGKVDLADAVCALNSLFGGAATPDCRAALDVNGDANVNITDPVSLLNFLFAGGLAPAAPFPDCGPTALATDKALGCENPPRC